MCETIKDCQSWIQKQPAGPTKRAMFMDECKCALESDTCNFSDEEKVKDYIDSLRRDPYVGMGI